MQKNLCFFASRFCEKKLLQSYSPFDIIEKTTDFMRYAMKRKITVLSALIISVALVLGVSLARAPEKIVTATNDTFALGENLSSAAQGALGDIIGGSGGSVGDILGGGSGGDILGGLGELGGLGDILGGIGDKLNPTKATTERVTYNIETIVPLVTKAELSTIFTPEPETTEEVVSTTHGLRVEEGAEYVPYQKPTETLEAGAEGDGVRWMQWIFIYTNYGLRADGITGILDEDTLACVRRLQQEKGMVVTGTVDEDTINAIELLYYEKQLSGNTGQYLEPSVSIPEITEESESGSEKTVKIIAIVVSIIVVWGLVVATVIAAFSIKKKKQKRELDELEKQLEKVPAEKKPTEISSIADLFEEANKR